MIRSVAFVTNGALSLVNFRGTLIAGLARDGVRVHGLAPDFDAASRAALRALGAEPVDIAMTRAGTNPVRELADAIRLWRTLRRLRPDAMLCYFLKPVIYGSLAAWAARVPRRIAMIEGLGHAFAADARDWRPRVLRTVLRAAFAAALRRADRVVFLNDEDAAQLVGARAVDPARVVALGGIGVDLDAFAAAPLPDGPVSFLLMARLLHEKGIADYAAAARIVRQRYPATRFVLLGALDPHPGALSHAPVGGWVAEGLVEWPGHVGDVRAWIAASGAVVLPSRYREGVPRSLQEAAAMGRAIVTTDHVGCRDTVVHGRTGFLVPVRAPEALAAAMLALVERPGLAAAMGRAGRALAEERFDARDKDARLRRLLEESADDQGGSTFRLSSSSRTRSGIHGGARPEPRASGGCDRRTVDPGTGPG